MIKKIVDFIGNPETAATKKKISYVLLAIVVVADFLVERHHAIYLWDNTPGWGAFYGFISCIIIILVSKFLGHQGGIMKREDYYDD